MARTSLGRFWVALNNVAPPARRGWRSRWQKDGWLDGGDGCWSCRLVENAAAQGWAAHGPDAPGEDHGLVAAGTRRSVRQASGFDDGAAPQKEAQAAQGAACGRAQEPEVAHGDEALGQHVKKPAADKFLRVDGLGFPARIGTVLVAQEHAAGVVIASQSPLVESGLAKVAREITQGAAAASGGLAMHHPVLLPEGRVDAPMQLGVFCSQALVEEVADARGQRHDWNKEVLVFGMEKLAAIFAQRHCRNEDVDVGMMPHPAGPGLQHGDEAALAAEMGGAEIAQALGALAWQRVVEFAGMAQAMAAQRLGYGDGQ